MADSRDGSGKKKLVVRSERYRRKQVPYFEDKRKADAYVEFRYDIRSLVRRECSTEFESWKKVPEELKKSMLGELSKKVKANKSNQGKKSALHHSDSRPFSYRMEVRRQGGSKFPEIDVFSDIYVRLGDELAESLHRQLVFQESASQFLPETPLEFILTETLDQTLERRPRTYYRGMGNARWIELASYKSQMPLIVQALSQSSIRLPDVHTPSTSEPFQPKHAQNFAPSTFEPVSNLETFRSPPNDDLIYYATLFS
ncbi:hypothetical protein D8674_013382 [Pyrus ussuriensis x Pyrus communis]|uniref:Uncharacterized protein n=1 Tax=Pyrus ussuriensis x Pyrus communis TaxID=2448454 RepID=A0A5N5GS65_9ROSA|nr:hypothetical protein D8674_013382 [Pyrus ussuriensis x Pyrus communis]